MFSVPPVAAWSRLPRGTPGGGGDRNQRPHALRHVTSWFWCWGVSISYASASRQPTWTRVPGSMLEPSFGRTTVSRSPPSVATRIRRNAPTNTTSGDRCRLAVAVQLDPLGADRDPTPAAFDDVRRADEPGDEFGRRPLVDLVGGADLLDPPVVEDGEVVAHRQRFLLVVRDVDERHPELALERLEEDLHLLAKLQVECAERLVEEEHLRPVDDRPRERDALALPARELDRLAVSVAAEADHVEHLVDLAATRRPALRPSP